MLVTFAISACEMVKYRHILLRLHFKFADGGFADMTGATTPITILTTPASSAVVVLLTLKAFNK